MKETERQKAETNLRGVAAAGKKGNESRNESQDENNLAKRHREERIEAVNL